MYFGREKQNGWVIQVKIYSVNFVELLEVVEQSPSRSTLVIPTAIVIAFTDDLWKYEQIGIIEKDIDIAVQSQACLE